MPLRAPTPPFGTPLRLVKPEPTDDPTGPSKAEASIKLMHDLFASHAHSTNPVASRSSAALPKSAGFKSTAQHMRHRGEGARHSTGSMIPLTSLLGAGHTPLPSTSGLPFSVPRPPREPFAGTVFDPAPTEAIQAQAADQASTGKAAVSEPKPEGAAGGAVAADSGVASGSPGGVTEVQQAATVAAEEDLHAAEHFAAGALQAPQVGALSACHHSLEHAGFARQLAGHSWLDLDGLFTVHSQLHEQRCEIHCGRVSLLISGVCFA